LGARGGRECCDGQDQDKAIHGYENLRLVSTWKCIRLERSAHQHSRQQGSPGREMLDENRLVPRVRALAYGAHAVECGDA
jgi:hypothetical protein